MKSLLRRCGVLNFLWAAVCIAVWFACTGAYAQTNPSLSDGWAESNPQATRIDAELIGALPQHLAAEQPGIRSVLVARNGSIAFEYYRSGVNRDSLHNIKSVTKSVLSVLVGIALDQGVLRSLDDKLIDFFPETISMTLDARVKDITLAHLLTLTPGFDSGELNRDTEGRYYYQRFHSNTLIEQAFSRPVAHTPGTQYFYSSLDTHVLSLVLARQAKTSVAAFAQQQLFAPLGIAHYNWPANAQGHTDGAADLSLRTRDIAKIGQLLLQQGQWQGRQLVSSAYVAQSTRRHVATDIKPVGPPAQWNQWGYGYLWYTATTRGDDLPAYYASGIGGQFLYVVPRLDLVVVVTSDPELRLPGAAAAARVIRERVLPAVQR